jgi:hypothetical protein
MIMPYRMAAQCELTQSHKSVVGKFRRVGLFDNHKENDRDLTIEANVHKSWS